MGGRVGRAATPPVSRVSGAVGWGETGLVVAGATTAPVSRVSGAVGCGAAAKIADFPHPERVLMSGGLRGWAEELAEDPAVDGHPQMDVHGAQHAEGVSGGKARAKAGTARPPNLLSHGRRRTGHAKERRWTTTR